MQPQPMKAQSALGIVRPPRAIGDIPQRFQCEVVVLRESLFDDRASHTLRLLNAEVGSLQHRPYYSLGRCRILAYKVPMGA